MQTPTEDRHMTGGAGFVYLVRVATGEATEVLAGVRRIDSNGCKADHHARLLDESDYLDDLSDEERHELYRFIAADRGATLPRLYMRLQMILEDVL